MVPRVQRKAVSKKSAKKAVAKKPSSSKAQQQKKAKKKAAKKPVKKSAPKAGKPGGDGAKRAQKPISKPPKLDMNSDVMEFIAAIDAYRKEYHRPFPGWSEILFVIKNLGYQKSDD